MTLIFRKSSPLVLVLSQKLNEAFMDYYACDWRIWPGADYDRMMRTAEALGSRLVQIEVKMDEAGCIYYVLALDVPDESTLAAYVEHAGQYLGMTEWYPDRKS